MSEIKVTVHARKKFRLQGESAPQWVDAYVVLTSNGDTASCHRSVIGGRLIFSHGSVALFIRHDDYREGR